MPNAKILPSPSHETDHNDCCHKMPMAFNDAFWASVPLDLARWLSADMICEIVELAEDNYSAVDIPEIIQERESSYDTGYPVNLLPGTVRRVLVLADFASTSHEIEFTMSKYGVGYLMAKAMAEATKEGA